MNIKTINNNIVILYENPIDSVLSLDTLKTMAVATFSEKNPTPVVAQFPEVTALTIPEVLISVLCQKSNMIVGDQSIGNFQARDVLGLITLTKKLNDAINKPIISYGFNYVNEIDGEQFSTLNTKIKSKYFKTSISLPEGSNLKYALPNLAFKKENAKYTIKFNEVIENSQSEESDLLRVNINVHYNLHKLPKLDDLKQDYITEFEYINTYISSIFT